MSGRSRTARSHHGNFAQHFLGSARLAAQLVEDTGVTRDDRVVEFGAGRGILTEALAARAANVLAVELDPRLTPGLARRFASTPNVTVLAGDATEIPLPATPYRVVANLPFNQTAAILHRLFDDPARGLVRAALVVQWQVARARARAGAGPPTDLLGATWGPFWQLHRGRRLPAALFRPPPSVDAAVLVATRRPAPLLAIADHREYASLVRHAFEHPRLAPFLDGFLTARESRGLCHTLGHDAHTQPRDLDAHQWARLFRVMQHRAQS